MKDKINKIICGDALEELKKIPDESVDCCITSPPYWGLRDYGVEGQLGLEKTPQEYVDNMIAIFREVKRVLKKEGNCWLNLGDSYANNFGTCHPGKTAKASQDYHKANNRVPLGLKSKDLVGIPWRVAFALQADGWYLRQDIIWSKPNPMPESVTDRCTKSHEYIFLMSKSPKYYFDNEAIKEVSQVTDKWNEPDEKYLKKTFGNGETSLRKGFNRLGKIGGKRNKRSVWTVTTKPFKEAHFATFPEDLILPMILAGCPLKGIVLDPFLGAGTTAKVAQDFGRNYIGIELNPEYIKIAEDRLRQHPLF